MGSVTSAADVGHRVEEILAEFDAMDDTSVRHKTEELLRTVVEFYGAGLERIVRALRDSTRSALLDELAEDPVVGGMLVVHDLHPHSTEQRVHAALDRVRPYLGSHSGDVSFVAIDDDGVLRLRLGGSCNGCPSSTVTVKLAIEQAIEQAAPEVTRVDVEGVVTEPARATGPGGRMLLPLVTDAPARQDAAPGTAGGLWVQWGTAAEIPPGRLYSARVGGADTVVCNADGTLYAYRNRCPACSASLAEGDFDGRVLRCQPCGTRYDVVLAGRACDGGPTHLDPLPLLTDDGTIRVAVPT